MSADITEERIAVWRAQNRAYGCFIISTAEADSILDTLSSQLAALQSVPQGVEVPERVEQTIMHVPGESQGNCFAAVFAGLLQIPIESIPNFDGPDWRKQVNTFLRPYGLAWLQVGIGKEWLDDSGVSGMWHEVSGTTDRFDGKVRHSCVGLDASVAWDPHPSQDGLVHQNGASIFVALQPWKMAHARLVPTPPQPLQPLQPIQPEERRVGPDVTGGVLAIAEERQRQIEKEGWTTAHDDAHFQGELAAAARCYTMEPGDDSEDGDLPEEWPWDPEWWKPTPHDRRRELSKAGALIAAEIDRLDRLAALKAWAAPRRDGGV